MNAPTPAADFTRHRFTLSDVLDLIAMGVVDKRVQLLEGDIHDMPADGANHARYAMALGRRFMTTLPADQFVGIQTTLKLADRVAPSPDVYVLDGALPDDVVPAGRIALVVEVADTTLAANLTDTAHRYARHGVGEYWVVDVNEPCIYVHRDPVNGAYPAPAKVAATEAVAPRRLPDVPVRLADIKA